MRETIGHFFPAAFCVLIIVLIRWVGSETGGANPVFLAFLPVCFAMMGLITFRLQRELGELRRHIRELEAKRS
jgi:hypothetical protein